MDKYRGLGPLQQELLDEVKKRKRCNISDVISDESKARTIAESLVMLYLRGYVDIDISITDRVDEEKTQEFRLEKYLNSLTKDTAKSNAASKILSLLADGREWKIPDITYQVLGHKNDHQYRNLVGACLREQASLGIVERTGGKTNPSWKRII
jgi:hypothetical protein